MSRNATVQSPTDITLHPVQPAARGQWPVSGIRRLWQDWTNRRHLEMSIRRLDSLSPHLLDDIGLGVTAEDTLAASRTVPATNPRPAVAPPKIATSTAPKLA